MIRKLSYILGFIIIILTFVLYLFLSNTIQENPEMGEYMLIAKTNIPKDTIIDNLEKATELFETKKISKSQIVENAIKVNAYTQAKKDGAWGYVVNFFAPTKYNIKPEDLQNLIGKKTNIDITKNQQIISSWIVDNKFNIKEDERLYAVEISYIDAVAGEISKGDWVDIWIRYSKDNNNYSEKLIGPLQVFKTKNEKKEIVKDLDGVPIAYEFSLNEKEISYISTKIKEGDLFFVKWNDTPSENTQRKITGRTARFTSVSQ